MEINGDILNSPFAQFKTDNFLDITGVPMEVDIDGMPMALSVLKIAPLHPYVFDFIRYEYSESNDEPFTFLGHRASKVELMVKNDTITRVNFEFQVFDIDMFYEKVVKNYGTIDVYSPSATYIESKGYESLRYKTPEEKRDFDTSVWEGMPKPEPNEYKILNRMTWIDIAKNAESSYMGIHSRKSQSSDAYKVSVVFKVWQ